MAKPRVEQDLESILSNLNDRIRALELERNRFGKWSLVEDGTTGRLYAVHDNGQNVASTIVLLANP